MRSTLKFAPVPVANLRAAIARVAAVKAKEASKAKWAATCAAVGLPPLSVEQVKDMYDVRQDSDF